MRALLTSTPNCVDNIHEMVDIASDMCARLLQDISEGVPRNQTIDWMVSDYGITKSQASEIYNESAKVFKKETRK